MKNKGYDFNKPAQVQHPKMGRVRTMHDNADAEVRSKGFIPGATKHYNTAMVTPYKHKKSGAQYELHTQWLPRTGGHDQSFRHLSGPRHDLAETYVMSFEEFLNRES